MAYLNQSDIVASAIGQGLKVVNDGKFSYDEFLVNIGLRSAGRLIFKDIDIPQILFLERGNVVAGLTTGLYVKLFKNKSNKESFKIGVNTAIGNILGSEILKRLNIEDKKIF